MAAILVEIPAGELIDKITILEIKIARIVDESKLRNVRAELEMLRTARAQALPASAQLEQLTDQLKKINESLWSIEDRIRDHERAGDFGPGFIDLARAVYKTNDHRAELKRQINELTGSRLVEEKSYARYEADDPQANPGGVPLQSPGSRSAPWEGVPPPDQP